MSLTTIKHTKGQPATVAQVQGAFVFYKKASTATSDVNVFVDNSLIATMSPNDSFNITKTFNQLRIEPLDVNNEAVFITAENAEAYNTSAVSGSVSIIGQPNIVGSVSVSRVSLGYLETLTRDNSSFTASAFKSLPAAVQIGASGWCFCATAQCFIDSITVSVIDATTGAPVPCSFVFAFGSYTPGTETIFQNSFSKNTHLANTSFFTTQNLPGSFTSVPYTGVNTPGPYFKFTSPMRLAANGLLYFNITTPATTGTKEITVSFEFHT